MNIATVDRPNFFKRLWQVKSYRRYLLWAMGLSIGLLIIFKFFYPYPDFNSDSYSYIYGAEQNLDINIWPIGYSKFLLIIHSVSHSDIVLIAIQYLLLEISAIYFFFTFLTFCNPSKTIERILFLFLFSNPLLLSLSNLIGGDGLFAALSLVWLALLIRMLNSPKWYYLVIQAGLLFLCFTVRNTAYYYPFVATVAFMLSRQSFWRKAVGIVAPFFLIIPFIVHTKKAAYKATGTRQFSLFTGWQLANNALYGYDYMHFDTTRLPTPESKEIDALSREFFRHVPADIHQIFTGYTGNYFIKQPNAPLKVYLERHYQITDEVSLIRAWGNASAIYSSYGAWLIQNNPWAFFKGFILLNIRNYFYPPLSNFHAYNLGIDHVWTIAQDWFDWKTPEVRSVSKETQSYLFFVFPVCFLFLNIYFLGACSLLLLRWRLKIREASSRLLLLSSCFLVFNCAFTVVAAMNILRYQIVPMAVCLLGCFWASELLEKPKYQESYLSKGK
jgi:hypothetical protein